MKKAIIIGASSGIGKALCLALVAKGYSVGITGRRKDLLDEIKITYPTKIFVSAFDINNKEINQTRLTDLINQLGGLDVLVFSSGIGEINPQLNIELELPTIDLNVIAFNEIIVWAYHFFEAQNSGHIVAITSIAGLRGNAIAPAYNASKSYQINYLEGLRQKAKKAKLAITITDVRPGFVATAMAKGDQQFWVASPGKVAKQITNAIFSKRNVIYVSKRWRLIAWLLKLIPRFLYERL